MTAPSRLEASVWTSPRFTRLARKLCSHWGVTLPPMQAKKWAAGEMAYIYGLCAHEETDTFAPEDLAAMLGVEDEETAVDILVSCNLAQLTGDGVRIKGCAGRTDWLRKARAGQKKGGKVRAESAKRGKDGRFRKAQKPLTSSPPAKAGPHGPPLPRTTTITTTTSTSTTKNSRKRSSAVPGYKAVLDHYFRSYADQTGKKPSWTGEDGKHLKALLKSHGERDVVERMDFMFSGRSWLKPPFTMGSFRSQFNAMVETRKGPQDAISGADLEGLAVELERSGR